MIEAPLTMIDQQLWGTFDSVRDHLYDQFRHIPFDPDTGLPPDELERQARVYLERHPDQPRVLQKAMLSQSL